jgi:hypothetical protein
VRGSWPAWTHKSGDRQDVTLSFVCPFLHAARQRPTLNLVNADFKAGLIGLSQASLVKNGHWARPYELPERAGRVAQVSLMRPGVFAYVGL